MTKTIQEQFKEDCIADDAAIAQMQAEIEIAEILEGETDATSAENAPPFNIAQATADANGATEALAKIASEAPADEDDQAPIEDDVDTRSYDELLGSVTDAQVKTMQTDLAAAFAERARYENDANPNNLNIQKTLAKVQAGHLAHGISKAFVGIALPADYLNKSEVSGKRRNVYALQKLQDLIYGANTGHVKNAINAAVLVSLVKLKDAGLDFTGAVAKACASDKMPIDAHYKPHLRRHTVSEATASTQSSSTMTALEDLGAVVNLGTQKFPKWSLTDTPLARRLEEVARNMLMPVTV